MNLKHAEAFCLMKYMSDDRETVEWLWNSRDGVVPYNIVPPDGDVADLDTDRMFAHVDWQEDVRVPFFVPPIGMRIFVSYDEPSALAAWDRRLAYLKEHNLIQNAGDGFKEEFIGDLIRNNQPRVVTVDEELQKEFMDRALTANTQGIRRPR